MASRNESPWARALSTERGRRYWRGVEELLDDPEFLEAARGEFPAGTDLPDGGMPEGSSRRAFLKLMGASLLLAGLDGCTEPPREKILPYTVRPKDVAYGLPNY